MLNQEDKVKFIYYVNKAKVFKELDQEKYEYYKFKANEIQQKKKSQESEVNDKRK